MTVQDLKVWLANKPDAAPVRLMIETENCQYDFPLTGMALGRRNSEGRIYEGHYVVLMSERPE